MSRTESRYNRAWTNQGIKTLYGGYIYVCVCVCEINVSTTDLSESKKLKLIFILFSPVVFIFQIH